MIIECNSTWDSDIDTVGIVVGVLVSDFDGIVGRDVIVDAINFKVVCRGGGWQQECQQEQGKVNKMFHYSLVLMWLMIGTNVVRNSRKCKHVKRKNDGKQI